MVCTPDQVKPSRPTPTPYRTALAEHVIERGVAGIDDDGAGRFRGVEGDNLAAQPLRHGALVGGRAHRFVGRKAVRLGRGVAERLRAGRRREREGRQHQG
jgi:hypothetical protein